MSNETIWEYLIRRGWIHDYAGEVYQWRDPLNIASWYTTYDAVNIELDREEAQQAAPATSDSADAQKG